MEACESMTGSGVMGADIVEAWPRFPRLQVMDGNGDGGLARSYLCIKAK
jgi:hypothetical protein